MSTKRDETPITGEMTDVQRVEAGHKVCRDNEAAVAYLDAQQAALAARESANATVRVDTGRWAVVADWGDKTQPVQLCCREHRDEFVDYMGGEAVTIEQAIARFGEREVGYRTMCCMLGCPVCERVEEDWEEVVIEFRDRLMEVYPATEIEAWDMARRILDHDKARLDWEAAMVGGQEYFPLYEMTWAESAWCNQHRK